LFKEKNIVGQVMPAEKVRDAMSRLRAFKKHFEGRMKEYGDQAVSIIEKNGLDVSDFTQKDRGVAGYFYRIRSNSDAAKYKPNIHVLKALESAGNWMPKTSAKKAAITSVVESDLLPVLNPLINFVDEEMPVYLGAVEVLKKLFIPGIISNLATQLAKYRDEKNTVLISDTPKILNSFINAEDAPFIFEKTGNRYRHFLIDEFQDTSDLQWNNLLPLIINSLSSGHFSMVVGDAKQSIYRWRGGNMKLLETGLRNNLKPFDSIIREENLVTNYRSKRNIIEFNNAFFTRVPPALSDDNKEEGLLHKVYSGTLTQTILPKNDTGGYVEVQFFEPADEHPEQTKGEEDDPALLQTLASVRDLLSRNYAMRDIAILVKRNSEGNKVAEYLFDNGISKILSPDSLLLSGSEMIQFIINVFRFLADNSNEVARSEIMYYYSVHTGNKHIDDLHPIFSDLSERRQAYKEKKQAALFDVNPYNDSFFNKTLPPDFTQHIHYLSKLNLYELSEHVIRIFGLNKKADAYIQRFQDLILEYSTRNNSSLSGFLNWWDESETAKNCPVTIPEDEDAIRIMTIHKSKGLQFPAVIIPYADWKMTPDNRDMLWVSSDHELFKDLGLMPVTVSSRLKDTCFRETYLEELNHSWIDSINLLYVAFTRAERELYVFHEVKKEGEINSTGRLIANIIRTHPEWQDLTEENKVFRRGSRESNTVPADSDHDKVISLKAYPSSRWQGRIGIATRSSDLAGLLGTKETKEMNYGIIVHQVLSEIRSVDDIPGIIDRLYYEGLFSNEEKIRLESELGAILSLPEMKYFFGEGWTIKAEREIILPGGEILRPDRVLLKDTSAIVIDFKTGKERSTHASQVNRYAEILQQMNYQPVEKYLVYVNEKRVLKID